MKKTRRTLKVGGEIRSAISRIFLRDLSDPLFHQLTVTDVEVAPDLRFARVWVSTPDDANAREGAVELLDRSKGRIRKILAQRLNMRHTPELGFEIDRSADRAMRIESLLREVLPEPDVESDEERES